MSTAFMLGFVAALVVGLYAVDWLIGAAVRLAERHGRDLGGWGT